MTTITFATPTNTNTRTVTCADCATRIQPNLGRRDGSSPAYLCPACLANRERVAAAWAYARSIEGMIPDFFERALTHSMLDRAIKLIGASLAPLILQAVCDRSAWLQPAGYENVTALVREEAACLGLDICIG